jgi:DNA-binding transcriptional LysR family regulator
MTRYLDDRCLANFVAIYDCQNLKRAAARVGLTQPAMSKSLARLEDDMGVILFGRRSRGLVPTPAGHELYQFANKLEAETRQAMVRIAGLDAGLKGSIRIGAGHMWSWIHLPTVIHRFLERFPNIEIDLVTAPMNLLLDELEAGRINVAVGEMSDTKVAKGFREHKFPASLQWPYIRPTHPLAQRQDVTLVDLVEFSWTGFFNNIVFQQSVAAICAEEGLEQPRIPLRSTSMAAIMELASKGDYVIVLPDDFKTVATKFGLERVRSQSLKMWNLQTSVVSKKDEHDQGALATLIGLIEDAARSV